MHEFKHRHRWPCPQPSETEYSFQLRIEFKTRRTLSTSKWLSLFIWPEVEDRRGQNQAEGVHLQDGSCKPDEIDIPQSLAI